jgi:hypothetical protein
MDWPVSTMLLPKSVRSAFEKRTERLLAYAAVKPML